MTRVSLRTLPLAATIALALSGPALAFDSGSTGADGALNPSVNTQIQLPPNGVLNYTGINIPSGVTVTFAKNTTNTPVVLLVGGDAVIAGTLEVSGTAAAATGAAGDGNIGDDGTPGRGGPGGYDGGQGGETDADIAKRESQPGSGPGGAGRSRPFISGSTHYMCGGSGGSFGATGQYSGAGSASWCLTPGHTSLGPVYGAALLLPLIGGSGGGGGAGGTILRGAGGGGGGGALLIAASGTLSLTGAIRANGGAGGTIGGSGVGGAGGGGSGGAIRLIATAMAGNGTIAATGGTAQQSGLTYDQGGIGGVGRIRLEAETFTRTAASTPAHTFGAPGPVFVAGLPTLRISKVGGIEAPAAPTGNADIALPESTTNPVTIEVATTGVPLGNTVTVVVTPAYGATSSHVSTALAGSEENASATASVTLPPGPSTLLATVSYSVPEAVALQSPYRELSGEDDPVTRIAMEALPDGSLRRIAITRAGREIDLSNVVAFGG